MPAWILRLAALFAAASYAIYACFDWFARIYTTQVPKLRQFEIALVSYAFNLNLGALIGSVGFRYRLYSRSGVDAKNIARIVARSEEHTSELQSLMRISYAVFCLTKKKST